MKTFSKNKKGNSTVTVILWIVGIYLAYSYFSSNSKQEEVYQQSPGYSDYKKTKDCSNLEPQNPYDYDSGHYKGFQWGEKGNSCGGNSDSFIEGCGEFERQSNIFTQCENNQ